MFKLSFKMKNWHLLLRWAKYPLKDKTKNFGQTAHLDIKVVDKEVQLLNLSKTYRASDFKSIHYSSKFSLPITHWKVFSNI